MSTVHTQDYYDFLIMVKLLINDYWSLKTVLLYLYIYFVELIKIITSAMYIFSNKIGK